MARFSDVLLCVDYDRTLTAPDSTIPRRNLEAIRYFIENGGAFTVNTGRSIPMTQSFRDFLPVSAPMLLYNGSVAYDVASSQLTDTHEIPLDMWQTVEKCLALFPDLVVEIQGPDAHYCCSENPGWDAYCTHQSCTHRFVNPGEDLGPFLKFSVYGEFRDVTVDSMYQYSEEELRRMDQAEAILNQEFGDFCAVFRAAPRIIDVHARGVSKARASRDLQTRLGRKILVCMGDAHNDMLMLEDADFAFVPSDAALADRFANVCPCGAGAVADVIYEKIPGILKNQA